MANAGADDPRLQGDEPQGAHLPGAGRSLAAPAFPADDGTADPRVRSALRDDDDAAVIARLAQARLLVAVVAVLDAVDETTGADKESSMAIVSMVNAQGDKGLLAFTGVDSMRAWDPQARPVPVAAPMAAAAALDDGAQALVIDVLGPSRRVLAGAALRALAGLAQEPRSQEPRCQEPPGP